MVSKEYVEKQLKKLDFNINGWGKSEVKQLPSIILPDEQIYEVVNGIYEGGFALLLATDIRVLLVDKKLMSFLTVEDLRFDMINEIDYNHRLVGAYITVATGNKTLVFRSYNKNRLRKLIGHVQHCMAETKKKQSSHVEDQSQHLEKINQQLQAYLVAQYKQQQKLHEQLVNVQSGTKINPPEPVRPPDELSNFLYARGLLDTYRQETGKDLTLGQPPSSFLPPVQQANPQAGADMNTAVQATASAPISGSQMEEIYAEGFQEVFGKHPKSPRPDTGSGSKVGGDSTPIAFVVNPIKVAYSKLPQVLRQKKFGLPLPSMPALPGHRQSAPPEAKPKAAAV